LIRILFLGDIVGNAAVEAVISTIPELRSKLRVDWVIANGENMHYGKGLNEHMCKRLLKNGVDVLTGGDHSFDKHLIIPYLAKTDRVLRPFNYPPGTPGSGLGIYSLSVDGETHFIAVLNLQGQIYFNRGVGCPFHAATLALKQMPDQVRIRIVDFHAEATAEKKAMGWFLDGQVSAVIGTHTHVQTSDARILPQGTAYVTDAGACAPYNSVIGGDIQTSITYFQSKRPLKYQVATGDICIEGVILTIDPISGKARDIECFRKIVAESTDAENGS